MKRRKLTRKQKARIVAAQNGQCLDCGSKLRVGEIEFDHRRELRMAPDAATRAEWDAPDNIAAICTPCHRAKTAEMAPVHAKARRQAGETGQHARRKAGKTKPIRSPGFRGWRKFNGDPVWR